VQFQLTGHVVHVGTGAIGPVVRSRTNRLLRSAGFLFVVPAILAAAAIVRVSIALVGRFTLNKPLAKPPGVLADYLSDVFAYLTARRIGSSGQTPITSVRIRDSAGQVFPVRIEGHFVSGAIAYGDSITLRLRIVDGVSVASNGENHTTREAIRLRR
jgi:hypothetical protein